MSTAPELELVNYGAGLAWLRPELDTAIRDADQVEQDLTPTLGRPEAQPAPEDRRYTLTDLGRRALARERLFGPWLTASDVCSLDGVA